MPLASETVCALQAQTRPARECARKKESCSLNRGTRFSASRSLFRPKNRRNISFKSPQSLINRNSLRAIRPSPAVYFLNFAIICRFAEK
jgi:hypothetical protein